jgi:hypothetical protein
MFNNSTGGLLWNNAYAIELNLMGIEYYATKLVGVSQTV